MKNKDKIIAKNIIFSFNCNSNNKKSLRNVRKLKEKSVATGVSFSFLVLQAIDNFIKENEF